MFKIENVIVSKVETGCLNYVTFKILVKLTV